MNIVGSLIILIIIGVLIYRLILDWRLDKRIIENGKLMKGTITRKESHGSVLKYIFPNPVIRYEVNGQSFEREICDLYFSQSKKVGSQINIIYWDKYPDRVLVVDRFYWVRYIGIIVFSITIYVLGILKVFFDWDIYIFRDLK